MGKPLRNKKNAHLEVGYEPESTSEDVPLFNVAWRSDSGWWWGVRLVGR